MKKVDGVSLSFKIPISFLIPFLITTAANSNQSLMHITIAYSLGKKFGTNEKWKTANLCLLCSLLESLEPVRFLGSMSSQNSSANCIPIPNKQQQRLTENLETFCKKQPAIHRHYLLIISLQIFKPNTHWQKWIYLEIKVSKLYVILNITEWAQPYVNSPDFWKKSIRDKLGIEKSSPYTGSGRK